MSIEQLAVKLREKVVSGEYFPGMFLREENLAKTFKVSRTPLRQALTVLTNEGLLRKIPNTGCMVRRLTMEEIADIYNIRSVLEGLTARLASERATSLDIEKIAYLAAAYDLNEQKCYAEPVPDNCKSVFQRDIDFHCAIAEASKSKELIKLIEQQHFIRRIMDNTNTGYLNRYSDKTYRRKVSHVQIVEAIQAHDPGKAEKLMRIHILDGKQEVVSTLLKQGEINESEEEFSF